MVFSSEPCIAGDVLDDRTLDDAYFSNIGSFLGGMLLFGDVG